MFLIDQFLPDLLRNVFPTEQPKQQLDLIEQFLLQRYVPLPDEAVLMKTLNLLNDTSGDYKMQEIAGLVGGGVDLEKLTVGAAE